MKDFIIPTNVNQFAGDIYDVAEKAKIALVRMIEVAGEGNLNLEGRPVIEFEMNGRKWRIHANTDIANLVRDYHNSVWLGGKTIGPDPIPVLPSDVLETVARKRREFDEQQRREAAQA